MHSSGPPLFSRGPRIDKPPHDAPPPFGDGIKGETTSPHPIPRVLFFQCSYASMHTAALSHVATATEALPAASNRDYARPANCHPGQTPLQIRTTATSKELDPDGRSCTNSVRGNDVSRPNKTITTQIAKTRAQEMITSQVRTSTSFPQPALTSCVSQPQALQRVAGNQLERR